MKLSVICQVASAGGWNYTYLLLLHLKKCYPNWDITVFYKKDPTMDLFDYGIKLQKAHIQIACIPQQINLNPKRGVKKLFYQIKKHFLRKAYKEEYQKFITQLEESDVIFYAWPYGIQPFPVKKPTFFIPHDFIYTHWFGFHCGNVYNDNFYRSHYESHVQFCKMGTPIVSSPYIALEFLKTFPEANTPLPHVVYLSRFNEFKKANKEEIDSYLKQRGLTFPYLLWASNWMYHKNIAPLLGAFYEVKQKYPNIKLILTGNNTGNVKVVCRSPFYCDHLKEGEKDWDIWGLGELPPTEFSIILQGATAVLNTSLCEAGAGSALDAWSMGIPMIMSDIPPFREQVQYLKTHAEFFDPRNSHDIADAILRVLDNPEAAKEKAKESEQALGQYTWDDVARQYAEIFMEGAHDAK